MKLQLQKNRLTSLDFLEHLPSLAELHLGENQLASLDARISTWNPLLLKARCLGSARLLSRAAMGDT